MNKGLLLTLAFFLLPLGPLWACGVWGQVTSQKKGNQPSPKDWVSSSYNRKKAHLDQAGFYRLDLGMPACGKNIKVFFLGNEGQEVHLQGWKRVDFTLLPSED